MVANHFFEWYKFESDVNTEQHIILLTLQFPARQNPWAYCPDGAASITAAYDREVAV